VTKTTAEASKDLEQSRRTAVADGGWFQFRWGTNVVGNELMRRCCHQRQFLN